VLKGSIDRVAGATKPITLRFTQLWAGAHTLLHSPSCCWPYSQQLTRSAPQVHLTSRKGAPSTARAWQLRHLTFAVPHSVSAPRCVA